MKNRLSSGLAPLALAVASFAAFAGCTSKFPQDKLEATVKSAFEKGGVKFKSVSCPADREIKAGDKFECSGELDEGSKVTVSVVQKDDKGNLAFDILGNVEQESTIAAFVSKKSGTKTDLKCPKKIAVIRKGESFTCDATQGDDKGKLVATAVDDSNVNYKLELAGKPEAAPIAADPEAPVDGVAAE